MTAEKKFYLTRAGLKKIKKEYEDLKLMKLAKTKGEAPVIMHSEDINPEYIALQEDLGLLEKKIEDFEAIILNAQLIKPPAKTIQETVGLGATVLVDINGHKNEFKIVGTLEADPDSGMISNESPVGSVLMGKKVGDEAITPGKTIYKIKKISYTLS